MGTIQSIMRIADVIRRRQGKTWRQIAKESGVNYRTISAWKCGRAGAGVVPMSAVLDALGLELVVRKKK